MSITGDGVQWRFEGDANRLEVKVLMKQLVDDDLVYQFGIVSGEYEYENGWLLVFELRVMDDECKSGWLLVYSVRVACGRWQIN